MNRPLSSLERVIWLIDQAVNQNWVMIARLSKTISEPVLRQALDIVQHRHPLLKCKFKDGEIPEFVTEGVPQIPLRVIAQTNEEQWMRVSDNELLEPFPWREGPLLRVVLINSASKSDLLLTVCHIIADGMSSLILMQNILEVVDWISKGESVIDEPVQPELPSSLNLLQAGLKFPPEIFDFSGKIKRIFYKPVSLNGEQENSPIDRKSHLIPKYISPADTKKLVSKSKIERTTVHGAICAALLQTIAAQIRSSQKVKKKGPLMLGCLSPINIRPLFNRPMGEDIGNFISDASHDQLVDENISLWDVSRRVKKALQREIKFGRDIKALQRIGSFLGKYETPLEMVTEICKFFPPVIVTNIGRIVIPEQIGDIKIEDLHYTASITPAAKDGFGIIAFTYGGRLTLDFIYAEPFFTRNRAEILIEGTLKRLKDAIT